MVPGTKKLSLWWVWVLVAIAMTVGSYLRIRVSSDQVSALSVYLTQVTPVAIPALVAAWRTRKTHAAVTEVQETAQVAVNAAQQAEHNTNGKLTAQFASVHRDLDGLGKLIRQHITDTNAHGGS